MAVLSPFAEVTGFIPPSPVTKPIQGSWFEFQHHNPREGVYWDSTCAAFSCGQWEAKIKEMAGIGLKYLVLLGTALHFKSFYPSRRFPPFGLRCEDPLEAVFRTADQSGINLFIGAGFYGDWTDPQTISDPAAGKKRMQSIEELTGRYGRHRSFYGWYWPDEASLSPYFSREYLRYVNDSSRLARSLNPKTKILIAPYGTRGAATDDFYVQQLERLDVDIIAYQDEVGVGRSKPSETSFFFERLKKAHDRASRIACWADLEVFEFEGELYKSALLPASFERVQKQVEAVSPWVETILIYQYQGMMNRPGSPAFAGHPSSTRLYSDYVRWLKQNHPAQLNQR